MVHIQLMTEKDSNSCYSVCANLVLLDQMPTLTAYTWRKLRSWCSTACRVSSQLFCLYPTAPCWSVNSLLEINYTGVSVAFISKNWGWVSHYISEGRFHGGTQDLQLPSQGGCSAHILCSEFPPPGETFSFFSEAHDGWIMGSLMTIWT